ncbi:MoaD/ThiS family protein [Candidatus Bipolaricaulota bacterium]|nr:MoaD/ThiS family protein [Candidatus Bipolaricaulota bacterium]
MRVEIRLYATFAQYAPSQRAGDPFSAQLHDGATLADLVGKLRIPEESIHLVIINGRIVHDRCQSLVDDDRVGLFPPVGGG